jgi:hypothetical protein
MTCNCVVQARTEESTGLRNTNAVSGKAHRPSLVSVPWTGIDSAVTQVALGREESSRVTLRS